MRKQCLKTFVWNAPHTSVCSVCGCDNNYDGLSDIAMDIDQLIDMTDDFIPVNH